MIRTLTIAVSAAALCACHPKAEAAVKFDAPPQAVLPQEGWRSLGVTETGVREAGKRFEQGVVKLTEDDFDGDGKPDQATLVANDKAGLYAVDVALSSGTKVRLASAPLEGVRNKVLRRVGRGEHTRNCGYYNADVGKGAVLCGPLYVEQVVLEQRAVSLFDTKTKDDTYILWDGKKLRAVVMDGPLTPDARRPDPQ
jgi:hypothetical protein